MSIFKTRAGSTPVVVRASQRCEESAQSFMRLGVNLVMARYDIHHSANGAAFIKQCRWATNHFHALHRVRIDWLAMISALGRQGSCAHAVLHDQHTVSVKSADHRPGTAGPG